MAAQPALPGVRPRRHMQQGRLADIGRLAEIVLRLQLGRTGGHHLFLAQQHGLGARPLAGAEMDGRIQRLEPEIEDAQPRHQVQRDPRMGRQKPRQPRRQPARAEGRQDGQVQRPAIGIGAQVQGRRRDAFQGVADVAGIGLAARRQTDGLAFAMEQLDFQLVFQGLDLAADRALRQVQLARRAGDAAQTGGGLESLEMGQLR